MISMLNPFANQQKEFWRYFVDLPSLRAESKAKTKPKEANTRIYSVKNPKENESQ